MLRSFINSFTKPQSLTLQLRAFHSKPKSHSKKIKYYEAHPNLFQKYSRMKPPDLTKKDITFPINIPIKFRYRFKPTKRLEIPAHDFLNFKFMTGNEILLYLERVSELKPSEICGALIELGKRPGAEKIDWSSHEFINSCKDFVLPRLSQYTHRTIHNLIIAFHRLKVFDPILWSGLHKDCNKLLHLAKAQTFGKLYKIFHDEGSKAPKEMLERMTTVMPNHIRMMSPSSIIDTFEIIVKHKYLNYYLFEDIFYPLFLKRNKWFGLGNYPRIIKLFIELKHFDDEDFWNKNFLNAIKVMKDSMKEADIPNVIESLKELNGKSEDKIKIDDYVRELEERLVFLKTKARAIENNQLFNIILNDLKYYKEKETDRLKRK